MSHHASQYKLNIINPNSVLAVCQAQFLEFCIHPCKLLQLNYQPHFADEKTSKVKQRDRKVTVNCGDGILVTALRNNRSSSNISIECHCRLHNADLKQKQTGARNFLCALPFNAASSSKRSLKLPKIKPCCK